MVQATPFRITETADLDAAGTDNQITIAPGEEKTVAEYEAQDPRRQMFLLALGATDRGSTDYQLYVDDDRKLSTRSPLGEVNQPFSFLRELGFVYPAEQIIEYRLRRDSSAGSSADYVARMYVTEEMPFVVNRQRGDV